MSDSVVKQIVGRLSMISFLDLSYCIKINAYAIEVIGKNCKMLEGLCRNMHPLDTAGKPLINDEAYAIASTMPKLKRLEMAYHLVSTEGILQILSVCTKLEFLDLRGCWGVKLDNSLIKQKFPKLKVLGPLILDYYEREDWDDYSDFSEESEYLAWAFAASEMRDDDDENDSYDEMWENEVRLEELELRFYEGIEDAEMYWPPSP